MGEVAVWFHHLIIVRSRLSQTCFAVQTRKINSLLLGLPSRAGIAHHLENVGGFQK